MHLSCTVTKLVCVITAAIKCFTITFYDKLFNSDPAIISPRNACKLIDYFALS